MIWEIILYLFLLIAFIIFIKASETRVFGRKLSLRNRILVALIFPILAVFLFIFGIFVLILVVIALLIFALFFLLGGKAKFKGN